MYNYNNDCDYNNYYDYDWLLAISWSVLCLKAKIQKLRANIQDFRSYVSIPHFLHTFLILF